MDDGHSVGDLGFGPSRVSPWVLSIVFFIGREGLSLPPPPADDVMKE